jgi:hypothetical protein
MAVSGHRTRVAAAVAAGGLLLVAACSGGDGAGAGTGPAVPAGLGVDGRCDLGLNTARYNDHAVTDHGEHADHAMAPASGPGEVDFTLDEWADVFVDEELGLSGDEVVDELAGDDVYRRHILGGVLTHTLEPDPWMPMADTAACERLAGELGAVRELITRYPTVADALTAGYTQGDTYYAGLGVHYQNWDLLSSRFDPARPVQLLYDGTTPGAHLVGVSYVVQGGPDTPPEGFTGDNDRWHRHRSFCLDLAHGGVNLSSDVLDEAECAALGGSHLPNENGWMLHTWVVPGCESDWGIFSGANPRLPYRPDGSPFSAGCNSGRSTTDRLRLDDRGSGPRIEEVEHAT